jgi:uncharacterized protein YcaQ
VGYRTDNALQHLAASARHMQELLQQIDVDYYRLARLLIVRAELEQLRQERCEIPIEASPSADRREVAPDYFSGAVGR